VKEQCAHLNDLATAVRRKTSGGCSFNYLWCSGALNYVPK